MKWFSWVPIALTMFFITPAIADPDFLVGNRITLMCTSKAIDALNGLLEASRSDQISLIMQLKDEGLCDGFYPVFIDKSEITYLEPICLGSTRVWKFYWNPRLEQGLPAYNVVMARNHRDCTEA